MDHTPKQYLTEGGDSFPSLKSQTVKNRSMKASAFFYTLPLMVVTIETNNQVGLVTTIAVSVSKFEFLF